MIHSIFSCLLFSELDVRYLDLIQYFAHPSKPVFGIEPSTSFGYNSPKPVVDFSLQSSDTFHTSDSLLLNLMFHRLDASHRLRNLPAP